jgi:hypothetical protein
MHSKFRSKRIGTHPYIFMRYDQIQLLKKALYLSMNAYYLTESIKRVRMCCHSKRNWMHS